MSDKIHAIYARSSTGIIGRVDGSLPVRCRDDMLFFKEKTMGATVIVGRKTFEGLPPLPGRNIIVVTSVSIPQRAGKCAGIYASASCPEEAINMARELGKPIFIIGGKALYESCIDYVNVLYETVYDDDVPSLDGDVVFTWPTEKMTKVSETIKNGCKIYEYVR